MQFRRTLPGAGSTDFYLTDPKNGGLSIEQQEYAADLIMAYRRKYPDLKINAVWDFGMEEADPVRQTRNRSVRSKRIMPGFLILLSGMPQGRRS